jgi:hypothetical protein
MKYKGYEVYVKSPCCGKEVMIELFDYYFNAIDRRNELIKSLGKSNVKIKKYNSKYPEKKRGKKCMKKHRKMKIAKCIYCNSIFVCWNWFHQSKEWMKKHNPYLSDEGCKIWGHECHKCNGVFETKEKVTNGIPYKLLMFIAEIYWKVYYMFNTK